VFAVLHTGETNRPVVVKRLAHGAQKSGFPQPLSGYDARRFHGLEMVDTNPSREMSNDATVPGDWLYGK
jgi:hypothetical protein